jgi:hypothetical protein
MLKIMPLLARINEAGKQAESNEKQRIIGINLNNFILFLLNFERRENGFLRFLLEKSRHRKFNGSLCQCL